MKITKLLLVEDDPILVRSIPPQMTKYGYRIAAVASSGEEAIAQAAQIQPELVLMDVDLRGAMDGVAAGAAIQQAHHIPILYITSHAESERTKQTRSAGPFSCLLKPLTEKELAIGIELRLCRHRHEVEQRQLSAKLLETQQLADQLASFFPICGFCGKIRDDSYFVAMAKAFLTQERQNGLLSKSRCSHCASKPE